MACDNLGLKAVSEMLSFFALSSLSDWSHLSKPQRDFVWRECIHPLVTSSAATAVKLLLGLVGVACAGWLGGFEHLFMSLLLIISIGLLPSEIVELVVVILNRHVINKFIDAHRHAAPDNQAVGV
jgi:hypothetical protein